MSLMIVWVSLPIHPRIRVDGEDTWIPKKLIHDDSEVCVEGDEGTLAIPEWLAEDEGLM